MIGRWARICLIALRKYHFDSGMIYAAAISYAALVALFPLLLILIVIVSPFLQPPASVEHVLERFLGFPGVGNFLSRNMVSVYEHRVGLGATGIVGLLLGASGIFGAMESALNRVWRVKGRPWISGRAIMFIALLIFSVAFLGGLLVVIFGLRSLRDSALGSSLPLPYGPALLALVAPPFINAVLFFLAYKFLPNAEVPTRAALGGMLFAVVLAEITLVVMTWYVSSIADYGIYDTAGAVFALLAWLYAFTNVFLLGAQVSAVLGRTEK